MTHVVTQHCCNDAACVPACPVNCIHPLPSSPEYDRAEMLYIDPEVCIDCGACADVCPVGAIQPDYDLEGADRIYIEINAEHFRASHARDYLPRREARSPAAASRTRALHVAIVGSGPAGCYAAAELLRLGGPDVRVHMFERLSVPWGLARFGVAPDHSKTKDIVATFERTLDDPRFRLFLGVDIGADVGAEELQRCYDGVVYATGALADRRLDIPGEELPGSHSAAEFAAWYNGHPDHAARGFDFDAERAIVVGNGNVALDVARILATDVDVLRKTDIAEHALEALSRSRLREIVVVGRRGPMQAAFTLPELVGLTQSTSFTVRIDPYDGFVCTSGAQGPEALASWAARRKSALVGELGTQSARAGRTLTLAFWRSPVAVLGSDRVSGLRTRKNRAQVGDDGQVLAVDDGADEAWDAGLVLRSVGYRGSRIPGLPFDDRAAVVPNVLGRVSGTGDATARGVYVAGWIKRGPTGVMGTNKKCAQETVAHLMDDHRKGVLTHSQASLDALVERLADRWDLSAWRVLDSHERELGRIHGRPRIKLVTQAAMAKAVEGRRNEHHG